jgi:phosphohistidine phosphatase
MRRLLLLRHAKTSWALPSQRDEDRALNDRGESDLEIIADWIGSRDLTPDAVICSTAKRTRQTLNGIQKGFHKPAEILFLEQLYLGNIQEYLESLADCDAHETVMIIGHNPTCSSLVNYLVPPDNPGGSEAARDTVTYKYPTGALSIIDLDIGSWSEAGQGSGVLVDFLMPKPYRAFS